MKNGRKRRLNSFIFVSSGNQFILRLANEFEKHVNLESRETNEIFLDKSSSNEMKSLKIPIKIKSVYLKSFHSP